MAHRLDHLYPPPDQRKTPFGHVYVCTMCGQEFMLRHTLLLHRAQELPIFRAQAEVKRMAYEAARARQRHWYETTFGRGDDTKQATRFPDAGTAVLNSPIRMFDTEPPSP